MNTYQKSKWIPILAVVCLLPLKTLAQNDPTKNSEFQVTGILNPFATYDETDYAREMNALTTQEERNALLDKRAKASIIPTIPSSQENSLGCFDYNIWFLSEASDWIKIGTMYSGDFLFGKNTSIATDSILKYKGTFGRKGTVGAKTSLYSMKDDQTLPEGHGGNMSVTGDDALDPESQNFIDAHYALTNLKPGKVEPSLGQPIIPANCERFNILWPYTFINDEGKEQLWSQRILGYKIVNGEAILTYNINDDPLYNKDVHLITKRESNIQGDAPYIKSMTLEGDVLSWEIEEANPRTIYAKVDNGPKIPLEGLSGSKDLNITQSGLHSIELYIDDYFNLSSEMTKTTNIIATALPETTKQYEIKAKPNPVQNYVTFTYPENTNTTITIQNTAGQTLEKVIDIDGNGQTIIYLSKYIAGLYPIIVHCTSPFKTFSNVLYLLKE